MQIVDVNVGETERIAQMAALLTAGFRVIAPSSWATADEALEEVQEDLEEGFCRAAVDDAGQVLGWVGCRHSHAYVWELHPLVVDGAQQGQGIGQALVRDLEEQARQRGCVSLMLGTDDEAGLTTLYGADLYDDIPGALAAAQGSAPHALEFYRKLGYTLIGVVPDANGLGKPDILMAKRL
ncbi:MAG: GNAT family N-acetyltransferase [Anaerolineae bacterium]|nr:GNAT family N-acetyltransferase [Anaerolineae bacterium]